MRIRIPQPLYYIYFFILFHDIVTRYFREKDGAVRRRHLEQTLSRILYQRGSHHLLLRIWLYAGDKQRRHSQSYFPDFQDSGSHHFLLCIWLYPGDKQRRHLQSYFPDWITEEKRLMEMKAMLRMGEWCFPDPGPTSKTLLLYIFGGSLYFWWEKNGKIICFQFLASYIKMGFRTTAKIQWGSSHLWRGRGEKVPGWDSNRGPRYLTADRRASQWAMPK